MMNIKYFSLTFLISCATGYNNLAQSKLDSLALHASLSGCVQYAIFHQPTIQQAAIDEDIIEKQIQTKLADWYPQLNINYNLQHAFELPAAYFSGNYIRNGTFNTSNLGISATQNIFNKDLLLAGKTANDIRQQVKQTTSFNKIDIAVNVSKAYYDVLLTKQQLAVLNEAIGRLDKSLKDAVLQYQAGLSDKIDFKRATIALNNAKAQKKQTEELVAAKLSFLKQLMGYPSEAGLNLAYDTARMEIDAVMDTTKGVQFENRIEFRLLQTQQKLLYANQKYYRNAYLPSVSAFGNYNLGYLNNDLFKTYNQTFSNSNIGVLFTMPIFQGNKRILQLRQADLQLKRIDWDIISLKSKVAAQYDLALAQYKGLIANYHAQKENVSLANDVYKTLDLQYKSGIKTYLEVIVAESDLRTAQINFYNALFQLLQAKLDVQKAMGAISY